MDRTSVIEGIVKFRDGKKWKSRWCVMRKLSPVADCLHLQLYRDSKDRYKNSQTKASLSLQHFLGVESEFTLDKESNTIAIICQDVIVVLSFDTREKLISWKVKIANNLGEDIHYRVLVSSAPPKSKVATGPAKLHIQDHRFCLTTGVPPRLAGLWGIGHLRRYGVVDGRFCFEGGSSCGKGEGLYVFVTDQSDEITHMLKLASQGRLVSKRRPIERKMSALDSPRKQITSQISDVIHEHSCNSHGMNSEDCTCHNISSSYWPSQESRDIDSNYGCGDTVSVTEGNDRFNDSDLYPRNVANIERCMSCISKLGAMSRSSTATAATPGAGPNPCWPTIEQQHAAHLHHHHQTHCNQSFNQTPILDSMSLGSHGSSNSSEYSVPRQLSKSSHQHQPSNDSWYEKAPTFQENEFTGTSSPCQCCPPPNRPPKPKNSKPPMPLPLNHVGPYENYDVPKIPYTIEAENYDTPKKLKDLLSDTKCNSPDTVYGNYDMPMSIGKQLCGCGIPPESPTRCGGKKIEAGPRHNCTCNRVMSWADNWITLPYCRRGNGIENTGVPLNKVRLSGEGKMPVMNQAGELAIYATVDMTKKIKKKLDEEDGCDECSREEHNNAESRSESQQQSDVSQQTVITREEQMNYVNLDFEKSLGNYENAKQVLIKMKRISRSCEVTHDEEEQIDDDELRTPTGDDCAKVCHKCGHHPSTGSGRSCENLTTDKNDDNENYMMMEPGKSNANVPGYIPMAPVQSGAPPPLPTKADVLKRLLNEKSASNPSLCGPAVDRSRKRCKHERLPGTAMMMLCRNAGSPYNRKQLMDSTDLLPDKTVLTRKRSSSAESSNVTETGEDADGDDKSQKSTINQIEGRRSSSPCLHQETELCEDESCCTKVSVLSSEAEDISTHTISQASQTSQQNYIRRSASVPCKGQNRDSSSSNDSGVSTGSLRHRGGDFTDLELPLSTALSVKKYQRHILPSLNSCVHSSLPRRSKSFDPLREISFQFQKIKIPEKSTSAEAEVPVCPVNKGKGSFSSPSDGNIVGGPPYIDSRSTSSGTSDMSDYIETLSLSSHSSSDTPDGMKLIRHQPTSTLRPRSGKEYQNIDRSIINCTSVQTTTPSQLRGLMPCSANYANITPVPENAESPSPGYQSGGSPSQEQLQNEHFLFKNESTTSSTT